MPKIIEGKIHCFIPECTHKYQIVFFLFTVLLCFSTLKSQTNKAELYYGYYTGYLKLNSTSNDSVQVNFEFIPLDSVTIRYKMQYLSSKYPEIVKDYTLRAISMDKMLYLLDEGKGLKIKMKRFNNCWTSHYFFSGQWMCTNTCFYSNRVEFLLLGGKTAPLNKLKQALNPALQEINSEYPEYMQQGVFYKLKN